MPRCGDGGPHRSGSLSTAGSRRRWCILTEASRGRRQIRVAPTRLKLPLHLDCPATHLLPLNPQYTRDIVPLGNEKKQQSLLIYFSLTDHILVPKQRRQIAGINLLCRSTSPHPHTPQPSIQLLIPERNALVLIRAHSPEECIYPRTPPTLHHPCAAHQQENVSEPT